MSGYSYMDTISTRKVIIGSIFCLLTIMLIPLAVSGHFSVFIYHFVVEKEEKTRFMMQVHGMKLSFYLLVNYLMYFCGSFASCLILWAAGCHLLQLPIFVLTSPWILILLFALWAHCQICLALFFQNFPLSIKITSSMLKSFWFPVFHFFNRRFNLRQRDIHGSESIANSIPLDSANDLHEIDQQTVCQST